MSKHLPIRLEHNGHSHIKLSCNQHVLHFDPIKNIQPHDIVVLTWNWPEKIQMTIHAVQQNIPFTIIAHQTLIQHIQKKAGVEVNFFSKNWLQDTNGTHTNKQIHRFATITQISYKENTTWPISEHFYRVFGFCKQPYKATKQFYTKQKIPHTPPQITLVELSDGKNLLHANLCFHSELAFEHRLLIEKTLEQKKITKLDWMIVGCDYDPSNQNEQSIIEHVGILAKTYACSAILITDLLNTSRQNWGFPTKLLTPLCDAIIERKHASFVFASYSSFRFE